ncbi:BQ2448_5801 [Microbotryum intermedium]|uniref:BQ2448_5801 protein n=1 Tax=Microbotryum intermedium TaxID=269621 RepID=A0A238F2C4_9BASI|nr:BQ2448_5801 [Microbotryum intermedium]
MKGTRAEQEMREAPLVAEDPSEYGPDSSFEGGSSSSRSRRAQLQYYAELLDPVRSQAIDTWKQLSRSTQIALAGTSTLLLLTLFYQAFGSHPGPYAPRRYHAFNDSCQMCSPTDDLCKKWGSRVLMRGRGYQGSGEQMAPFLDKVRRGHDIRIGIIGGSISACVDAEPEKCYHEVLSKQLQTDWGVKVEIVNGGVSAVGSDFFASCWHMSFSQPIDLFILELAVNDEARGKENNDFDVLVRTLLSYKWQPSLLVLSMYSPLHAYTNGAPSIENIAEYYDLPVISHRNVVVQQRHLHTRIDEIRPWFSPGGDFDHPSWPGGHHPGVLGHELTSDLIVSYLREQSCLPPLAIPGSTNLSLPASLPGQISPWSTYQRADEPPAEPTTELTCYTAAPGPTQFPIAENHGFKLSHWKSKEYLVGYKPGDRIVFNLKVTQGVASIMYWRSWALNFGRARFWLDGEKDRAGVIWGDWGIPINSPVRHDVRTDRNGDRQMFVEIDEETGTGKHEFRISAIIG